MDRPHCSWRRSTTVGPRVAIARRANAIEVKVRTWGLVLFSSGLAMPEERRFPMLHNKVGVRTPGAASVDACVKFCRCFRVLVTEKLPDQFVSSWIGIKDDL